MEAVRPSEFLNSHITPTHTTGQGKPQGQPGFKREEKQKLSIEGRSGKSHTRGTDTGQQDSLGAITITICHTGFGTQGSQKENGICVGKNSKYLFLFMSFDVRAKATKTTPYKCE